MERTFIVNIMGGKFSSLSESGFIPTLDIPLPYLTRARYVLISFREWLHSYDDNGKVSLVAR